MTGVVHAHHALVEVVLRLPGQPDLRMEFVLDTGFVGHLTLPPRAVAALGLPLLRWTQANLADDSRIYAEIYEATIVWNGEERVVEVLATGQRPLLGTLLLDGCELTVQFADGGLVTVEPL